MAGNAESHWYLPKDRLAALVEMLRADGYTVLAPVRRSDVIALAPIRSADEIVRGLRDEQDGGYYRLVPGDPQLHFESAVSSDSPKNWFFPARQELFRMRVAGERLVLDQGPADPPRLAMIGIRGCDLAAIAVQDRVFGILASQDTPRCASETYYSQGREQSLLIAADCTRPGGTCFCASWQTGPRAGDGHDLAMTELRAGFVVRAGSERGRKLIDRMGLRKAESAELELAELKLQTAAEHMGRSLATAGVKELLDKTVEHPRWEETARRCLSCGNCTMVCPTCFCSTVTDASDPTTGQVSRERLVQSCYAHEFTYMTGGGPARSSIRGRYRHWLRHKLCTWWDQFATSGCIGCGRCITWCPVGIDLTEDVTAIRLSLGRAAPEARGVIPAIPKEIQQRPRTAIRGLSAQEGESQFKPVCGADTWMPVAARLLGVRRENMNTHTYRLQIADESIRRAYAFAPGQFNMIYVPGVGEAAISISSSAGTGADVLEHTIRVVGSVTRAVDRLSRLEPGAIVGLRGPFGRGWPTGQVDGHDVVLVAGGIGLAPLRPMVYWLLANRDRCKRLVLLYGCRSPEDQVFAADLAAWSADNAVDVLVTVDNASGDWIGPVGVVTDLLPRIKVNASQALVMVCGPRILNRVAAWEFLKLQVPGDHVYVSLERNMNCGFGRCGHCQYGDKFVCTDGPVFAFSQIEGIFGVPEI